MRDYKRLCGVERAFRSMKSVDLHVRPVYHWHEHRVEAHKELLARPNQAANRSTARHFDCKWRAGRFTP
jgi:hypothetical protein